MATGSRTLKLSILADVDQLRKSLQQADGDVKDSASRIGDFSKKVGAAFAVAGAAAAAYAVKIGVDGVKAAIADEAAQNRLATTLRNVVGASSDQIKNVEQQILKNELLFGVTDEKLRPSLDRLVRSTQDVTKAQELQNLALNISAGTGKDLETVTNALAKAYDGNFGALTKLGVSVDANILKSKDFDAVAASLATTFKDQASVQAETFQGKLDRLKIAFDEGKETIGGFILDAITPLLNSFVKDLIPALIDAGDSVGKTLAPAFDSFGKFFNDTLIPAFKAFYNFIKDYVVPILEKTLVPVIKAIFDAFDTIATALKDNEENLKPLATAFETLAKFLRDDIAPILGKFVSGAIAGVADVIKALVDVAGSVTKAVTDAFDSIKKLFSDIKTYFVDNAKSIFSPLYDGMKSVLNSIIGIWNKLDFGINITVPDWVPLVGGKGFKVTDIFPDVPYLASGGIVTKPTLAMIGEAGAEAVIPLNKSNAMGDTYNITVNGAMDAEGTARTIVNILNNSYYRGTGGATALVTS